MLYNSDSVSIHSVSLDVMEKSLDIESGSLEIFKAPPLPPVPTLVAIEILMSKCVFGKSFCIPLWIILGPCITIWLSSFFQFARILSSFLECSSRAAQGRPRGQLGAQVSLFNDF